MSGAVCVKCMRATNDATIPTCDKPDCPGKQSFKLFKPAPIPASEAVWDEKEVRLAIHSAIGAVNAGATYEKAIARGLAALKRSGEG